MIKSLPRDVVDEPYRRPLALDEPPPERTAYVAWLDAVPVQASRRDGVIYRYQVCQAFATVVGRDELTWNVATLASDVEPVAGAQLVDGLRALRESRRGCHRRMRWPR